jgi:hypothetical protein
MKHTVSMITALLLVPLAALHAAETTNVQLDGGRCLKVNGKLLPASPPRPCRSHLSRPDSKPAGQEMNTEACKPERGLRRFH